MASMAALPVCLQPTAQAAAPVRAGRLSTCPINAPLGHRRKMASRSAQRLSLRPHTADPAAPVQVDSPQPMSELVDRVLTMIEGTDSGDSLDPAMRSAVDGFLRQLDDIGEAREQRPLDDPLVFGNYNVAYVSAGPKQYGQPVGGRFRGTLGKLLFRTTFLGQSVLQPNIVTNKVAFRLLGFLPGSVGLRGTFVGIPEEQGGEDRRDTVKVFFDPPVLSLPAGIHVRIGPPSSVVLKTTYVDERVRLGKGSRGSLFVFTRGGQSDKEGMDQVGLQQCSGSGKALLWGLVAAFLLNGGWLAARASLPPVIRAAGVVQLVLGLALGGVVSRGGIEGDNNDRPEVIRAGGDQGAAADAAATQPVGSS